MDYEKEFEKETGYNARYSQGGITRESLKYVNWLKSKCDALQAELLDARTRLDEQRIMTDEREAEVEKLTNQLDGKYQIMEKQLATIKERDTELQSLRDEVGNGQTYWAYERDGTAWFHKVIDDGKVITQEYLVNTETDDVTLAFMIHNVKDCLNLHLTDEPKQVTLAIKGGE